MKINYIASLMISTKFYWMYVFISVLILETQIKQLMSQQITIASKISNFIKKEPFIKRVKTISYHNQISHNQNADRYSTRKRIMSIIDGNGANLIKNKASSLTQLSIEDYHTPTKLNQQNPPYQDQADWLAKQFITDFQKMNESKDDTYRKLRSKFVRKYPQYRQRYVSSGIDVDYSSRNSQQVSEKPLDEVALRKIVRQTVKNTSSQQKSYIRKNDNIENVAFYSRSKRKCLTSVLQKQKILQSANSTEIPKLSYLVYMRKRDHRKIQITKIKGRNIMIKRDDIMLLEKQGTKSYMQLKKCLEDAIDVCSKGK